MIYGILILLILLLGFALCRAASRADRWRSE